MGPGPKEIKDLSLNTPQTVLTIQEEGGLIGGPAAQGRIGDVLLSNGKIRVVIQKPSKDAGIGSFGGTIIDADRVRSEKGGRDQWGELFPMLNVEWTVNNYTFDVIADGKDGGPQILRAFGRIDTYDYLDLDWVADAASAVLGQQIAFADQFDDRRDPFRVNPSLKDLSPEIITEYRLEPGANYVQIDTTLTNPSTHPISLPVGDFLAGSGEIQLLIPGLGFSPPATAQIGQQTPAVIYAPFPGGDVSYGYFYDIASFLKPKEKKEDPDALYTTTSLSYSGLTGVLLGEEFLKVLPIGSHTSPEIHFTVPPESSKTLRRYFVVGGASAGSILDAGLKILKVPSKPVAGQVASAGGGPVSQAVVAIKKLGGPTVITYTTDAFGKFGGHLPTGEGLVGAAFGEGKYEVWVEKEGYHENGALRAGHCTPSQIDLTSGGGAKTEIACTLGESGLVELQGGVLDTETGKKIPARLTIVGEDPSAETKGAYTFSDRNAFYKPFGIVDVKLINAAGGFGLTKDSFFELEPGSYRFVFSHGPEYSIFEKDVTVEAGAAVILEDVVLHRVVATPGFVSTDFHIHALPSPDSPISVERRALAAVADGLDILQSSDHDFLTDYRPVVEALTKEGILSPNSVQTLVGDEITPNHYGHIHAFPLNVDLEDVDHGALDWSATELDEISPAPDYCLSPRQIVEQVLLDPGEEVIQINHISDNPTGLPVAAGWLTTPIYQEKFGVPAFVSYADPVERRLLGPPDKAPLPPYSQDVDELIFDTFTSMELAIGSSVRDSKLWESSLPTWFNLLNLGLMPAATGNSDSHHEISAPLGIPRNYVASRIDPRDGLGNRFADIDEEEHAHHINERHVVVSAGPFISLKAVNEEGGWAGVGEVIGGKTVKLHIEVTSPEWAWFDTIEIYANTEPVPAEDSGRFALRGEAANPAEFAAPYHVPRYIYEAVESFKLTDGSLKNWTHQDGVYRATLDVTLHVKEDTWVVVLAKGTKETKGYRSLFPIVPEVLKDPEKEPEYFDPSALEAFHKEKNVGASAWAFTNPVFIDVDGDADKDGFPFEAKWVREGYSSLKPFKQ